MQFEMLKEKSSIIKVIGVGGGGGNAVNHMYRQGITGVDFIICNTDAQALESSPIPNKVRLGASLTEGMGAGSIPEVGKNSAIENIDDIKAMLGTNTKMLFITAGMGGGTGTGASPVIAKAAREMGILTVAIITTPFAFEGKKRRVQADDGLEELKKYVDSYLAISNDRLRDNFGNLTLASAFSQADNILATAAKGIAEIITVSGYINVDFKDVNTVMKDSGVAIMGSFAAGGEGRALEAVEGALTSPLLKDSEIEGARYILLNISSGTKEVTMDEVTMITDYVQEKAGSTADLIWGNCFDESLEDKISVTIIATGFQTNEQRSLLKQNEKIISVLTPKEPPLVRVLEPKQENTFIEPELKKQFEPVLKSQPQAQSTLFQENNVQQQDLRSNEYELKPNIFEQKVNEADYKVKVVEPELFTEKATVQSPPEVRTPEPNFVPKKVDTLAENETMEEKIQKARAHVLRMKDLSMKMRVSGGLQELENEPAYKRKQMQLDQVQHSSQSHVSRYTLTEEHGQTEIKANNSFLHDNVD